MRKPGYLVDHLYTADPAAHVFNGKLYIYPSHDIESGIPENDNGDHFDMRDYHVFSMDEINGEVTDHGVVIDVKDIPWGGRQLWDSDVAVKNGKYYLYFPLKDKTDIFRIGVAISDKPEGPFVPLEAPIRGSYSIDPCVFCDDDGSHFIYFGGLWGGQLQRYRNNKASNAVTNQTRMIRHYLLVWRNLTMIYLNLEKSQKESLSWMNVGKC